MPTVDESAGIEDELRLLRYVFSGAGVPGEDEYLATPRSARVVATGSAAPIVASRFVVNASGLYVPEQIAVGPAPVDLIQIYITAREIFGVVPPLSLVVDHLSRVSFEDVAHFCGYWLNELHRHGADRHAVDAAFVDTYLRGPARVRTSALLRDLSRVLVAPQGMFVLLKLAAHHSGDAVIRGTSPGNIAVVFLALLQHLGAGRTDAPAVVSGTAGWLGREIISNQIFHAQRSPMGDVRRFMRRWVELPEELAGHSRVVSMIEAFRDATGVDLVDFVSLICAMWGRATEGPSRIPPSYFDSLGWSKSRLERALGLFVAEAPRLRAEVRGEASQHDLAWAISTFERFPVMRTNDGNLIILDPYLLARRAFGLLPLFDVTSSFTERREMRKRKKLEASYAHLTEAYAHELMAAVVPSDRLYGEDAIQAAYGTRRRNADAAADYGDAWLIVEITTSRPRRETVSGQSDDAVSADLDKLLAKAEQIEATIDAIRADAFALTNSAAHSHPRFHPVLIATEGFPINPISVTLLRERLAVKGVLQRRDIAPLEILDLEELEIVAGVQACYGRSFRELLVGHEQSGIMLNVGLREYILHGLRLEPAHQQADVAERLFDWVVSNVQGDAEMPTA